MGHCVRAVRHFFGRSQTRENEPLSRQTLQKAMRSPSLATKRLFLFPLLSLHNHTSRLPVPGAPRVQPVDALPCFLLRRLPHRLQRVEGRKCCCCGGSFRAASPFFSVLLRFLHPQETRRGSSTTSTATIMTSSVPPSKALPSSGMQHALLSRASSPRENAALASFFSVPSLFPPPLPRTHHTHSQPPPHTTMFEARLTEGNLLKKIIEAIKDLVQEANVDCSETGLTMQAMDASHVSLCSLNMRATGFDHFRCDRSISLGLNLSNLGKILKCAGNEDVVTLKAEDEPDTLTLMFEAPNQERISDFELKLMDIETEHLGIPNEEYKCTISMPSNEFQRIIRDLAVIGETCIISCTKEGVRFSVSGDLGKGNVTVRQSSAVDGDEKEQVKIQMEEPVTLNFALRYLGFFTKATPLGPTVKLHMSPDVPIVVEYPMENIGSISYFLAPKIDED